MGTLYLVATPIGNLEDVTLRALRVLAGSDRVLAEDTRRTRVLLEHHGIAARPSALHAHNEAARTSEVLAILDAGGSVALVSDAGTPLVSDPGERLAQAAVAAGHALVPIPGASAVLAALVASGLPATPFHFEGFLPRRAGERRKRLAELSQRRETLVLFESPRRVAATLAELAGHFGPRRAALARELSKLHEVIARGLLTELAERFAGPLRGEVTLVVAGAERWAGQAEPEALDRAIRALVAAGSSPREIAALLAPALGRPRRELYARAVVLAQREDRE